MGDGGAKRKYRDNIAALQVLRLLRSEQRAPTLSEQSTLVRYVGWGGLPQAFDHNNSEWRSEFVEIGQLLTQEDYARARRSTQDAHYTSRTVIDGIYKGLARLGFVGGRILEPSGGIGHFIGLMPSSLRATSHVTAIELDPTTADIARQLYPSTTHINRGFQDVAIPSEYFDACVGNPPFGSQSVYDPLHRDLSSLSIHNYFIAKSIEKLRPGGLLAFVVSRYFMDARDTAARSFIAERAHLLGAIRLPNTAFRQNALTDVTTDIVFLQKARQGEQTDKTWVDVGEIRDRETGDPIGLNRYFIDHPAQMCGRMTIVNGMHRNAAELIAHPGLDLSAAIEARLAILPEQNYQAADTSAAVLSDSDKPTLSLPDTLKIGSYFLAPNGQLARRLPNVLETHDYVYVEWRSERSAERVKGMIRVRDCLRDLMLSEQSADSLDAELDVKRAELNRLYDDFVRRCGHVSAQGNRLAMSEDPEYPLLQALESNYDRGISAEMAKKHGVATRPPSATKATIFSKRVLIPKVRVTRVDSAKDALVVSLNENGRIDLPQMMRLTGKSQEDLVRDLRGLIYRNPVDDNYWEPAQQYLSGNVKQKLAAADSAAEKDRQYLENVDALRAVQPADIDAVDISIQLGSTWVPADVIDRFVGHLCGNVHRKIHYQSAVGRWIVAISPGDQTTMTVTWGTADYPANALIEAILTNATIQVKRQVGEEHGRPIYEVDDARTSAAIQKADEIRQAFLDWVWEDKERRERLARIYNERFNTNIATRYDGSHLQLPGTSLGIVLRSHQKDGIWRGIQEGTALYDHVVGAGKTLILVGTIMESKRMGLMTKPMLLVPNHLLLQWKDAFYSLYPRANILVAEKSDFQKANRERLFARIATGEWDAVIVAHSSFKKIGMPETTLDEILREQIDDLTRAMTELRREDGDRITIKEMEKARDRMQERLERKANTGAKDRAVTFEDLGVDALFVDEAHEFKNLFITTTLSRISGLGNLRGSEKAFDLFVKCRYLQQRNRGRGVFFATGTPISNTIAELYTMQRYLQYDELRARGIAHFDSWASVFGRVVTGWELDATGVNYRINSRFSKFQNVPELTTLYRTFADVITQSDLQQQAKARGTRFPVPRIRGGRPQNVVVERSSRQASFMGIESPVLAEDGTPVLNSEGLVIKDWNPGSIIHRMEHLPKDPRIDNPLKITNEARKAGLDFRLIDPTAVDDPGSKVNAAVSHIYRIWNTWRDRRGTQLVFCDLSTPKLAKRPTTSRPPASDTGVDDEHDDDDVPAVSMDEILASSGGSAFSVYDDIKGKLIVLGVPANEVRFIHEATTDLQKAKLFDEMNRGDVRILLGSTAKMGAGTNVQRRLVAEHHLDAPWRPSDLEQREGRILRQGNLFYEEDPDGFEVEILRFATKQTYDSRMWQVIEFKATAIEQFRKGDSHLRVIEDVAGEAANAAEMKAAATGNPLIFLQVKLSTELRQLEALFSNYKRARHSLESRVAWLVDADRRCDNTLLRLNNEIALRDKHTSPSLQAAFEIEGRVYGPKDFDSLQAKIFNTMKEANDDRNSHARLVSVGQYRGFEIEVYATRGMLQFAVHGSSSYEPDNLVYDAEAKFSARGFLARLDNFLHRFEEWRQDAEGARDREKIEYAKAISELKTPFAQQARLEVLRNDVREVMAELKRMQADGNYVSKWHPRSLITTTESNESAPQIVSSVGSVKEPRAKYCIGTRP